jgi:hypothetical protein
MSKNLDATPVIGVMWQAARKAIAEAESILMFGVSMPTSDELFMQMIRASIHAERRLRRLASIDIDPNGVLERFHRCVPRGMSVEAKPYPVIAGTTPAWVT